MRKWFLLASGCLVLLAPAAAVGESPPDGNGRTSPSLVVVVVVDQLHRDRLTADLPGGLGRLAREGTVFARAELAHAATETCPGHAALLTGRHPGVAGLAANFFIERESGTVRYCVEDDVEAAAVLGSEVPLGRSPRLMRSDALGDWMKRADPESRVFAVSAKDRSAIALGGQHPDGVFWRLATGQVGFTSSRYYARELPGWVRSWNRGEADDPVTGLLRDLPDSWEHATATRADGRRDDTPGETRDYQNTSGHPLRDADAEVFMDRVYQTPFMDKLTLDFAQALVAEHQLGVGTAPDLLAISLSGNDSVGHLYGPESHEARDALERIDVWLGEFLATLEQGVGREQLLVALSSDHGVLPLPEWLDQTDRRTCPVEGSRIELQSLRRRLFWHMHSQLGPWYAWPRGWLQHIGKQVTVDRSRAADAGRSVDEVVAVAERWLEAQPGIEEVWTATELSASAEPMAQLFRNSRDFERSGDLVMQGAPGCLITIYPSGTGHGAPYDYDREVPLVLWGGGVESGVSEESAATVDLGPTLARKLGIDVPDDLDGRSLLD